MIAITLSFAFTLHLCLHLGLPTSMKCIHGRIKGGEKLGGNNDSYPKILSFNFVVQACVTFIQIRPKDPFSSHRRRRIHSRTISRLPHQSHHLHLYLCHHPSPLNHHVVAQVVVDGVTVAKHLRPLMSATTIRVLR